jgi:hypothetical protein
MQARPIRVAVVGSRDNVQYAVVAATLDTVKRHYGDLGLQFEVVSGGARGVDTYAANWADANGIGKVVFQADWAAHGRSAGMKRNADIINAADVVLAFWDGKSPGTRNSIERTRAAGKQLFIFGTGEEQKEA